MEFDLKKESEMFDKAAEYYDKFRPGYPVEIVEAMVLNTKLCKDSKTLEIGAGSGKATEHFNNFGFSIRCIDPGENLVRNGNIKFSNNANISFECSRFEDLVEDYEKYDVIFAAQSFHWIPQPIGYKKCAEMLKDNGYLALIWNMYITYDNEEDNHLLELSRKYGGFADFVNEEQCSNRIHSIIQDIENSGLFEKPNIHKHLWEQEYTAEDYYGFVLTGNRFIQLQDLVKEQARQEIVEHARKYGNKIIRPYLCVLYLAKKKN